MLQTGKVSSFCFLALLSIAFMILLNRARKGKIPQVRRLPAIDAIDEAVGRATEMGRPVHFSSGVFDLADERSPQTLAGLSALTYVSRLCAEYHADLIVTAAKPDVYVVSDHIVRQSLDAAGRQGEYGSDMVRFVGGSDPFAYAAGVVEIMYQEQVAANIMIGAWQAESLIVTEAGAQTGGIQITGSATISQLPFLVVASDYCLIGEEIYAASAYLSQNPVELAAIAGQDAARTLGVIMIAAGLVFAALGSDALIRLLRR